MRQKMAKEDFENTFVPFEEALSPEEFTNRKDELEFLWSLADKATRRAASSYCIIARKGVGKTALMLEFYRQLFTQQKKVVPFFVSFAEYQSKPGVVQLTLEKFISKLFVTFAFQYGAFKSGKFSSPPELPETVSAQKEFFASLDDRLLEREFLNHLHALETNDIEGAFDHAVAFARSMTLRRGEAGIVMIDEFQVLTEVYDDRYKNFRNITEWFQKPAEARWCPMVVSGSAVSLVVDTVMGGLLARRFGPYYLDPFAPPHGLEYAHKLGRKQQVKLSEEAAAEIHRLTGGNPYYIWCFFNSLGLKDEDLSTLEKIAELYTFETIDRKGKIRQFWDTHFKAVADKINHERIGLQVLYQLAVAKQEVRINEVATNLGVPPETARRVLKNLEEADLIERQTGPLYPIYHRITDPILAAYVEREYQTVIAGQSLETFIQAQLQALRKRAGDAARILGEAAELKTRLVLLSFAGQEVDAAAVFNLESGPLRLPKFNKVEHRTGLVIKGEMIEFDLLAEGEETWLVEVKYRKTPVRAADVEKFLKKLSKTKGWSRPAKLPAGKRLWFFSRRGFDEQAAARLRELNILHSDILGFNALCRAVNIGELPVID
jgi:DNA-binding Lrp family transcriptional regulator